MRALALLPLLATAACAPSHSATEAMLQDRGVLRPTVSAEPWWLGPCGWTEPYTARFVGWFGGHLTTGIVCATSEGADDARLVSVRQPWAGRE